MIIKNVTEGIEPLPYQQALWDKIYRGGFKQGEMQIISAGRQTGKSLYQKMVLNKLYGTNLCKEIMLPMKPKPKYQFSRSNWYVAEYKWMHHDGVIQWCTEQFGPHPNNPDAWSRWHNTYADKIQFRDAKDYEWFLLRWS
jgi:hypothetical protein